MNAAPVFDASPRARDLCHGLDKRLHALGSYRAGGKGGANGAGRLALMPAIAELTIERQDFDILESGVDICLLVPNLEPAHAGRIDDGTTAGAQE